MSETATDPADWRRAIERFEAIGALEPGERSAAMAALRHEDPALHARVTELFGAGTAAAQASFLAMPGEGAPPARDPDLAGRLIGPWEIVRELGAGGMGRVWLARRRDGRYEGQVAIKLLKASLAERGASERFAREGRILGALAHPNIARLVDAGTLDDAQPYLVLEYIEGERIDDWCDAQRLDLRARVELFAQVCDAVAYAHANLVVHRDLKPSNILVTGAGEVKLLDFGIAKLIDEERGAAEETELTQLAGRALTPEYAAPEQVSGAPITTATDVYSLGVVLYRLLAGQSPYARADGSRPSAFELQRDVLETEPRRLSSTTVSAVAAATMEEIAAHRATTPARLGAALAGDLDNIVAKALRKNPQQRYDSARALRDDLRRYVEHRPVEARGDSAGYVVSRFVRRHRVAVAAGIVMIITAAAGIAGVLWQARLATQEATRAQVQADRANAVSQFMAGIFQSNSMKNPDPAKARATPARELLDVGRERAAKDLAGNPEAHQEVLLLLGKLYYELSLPAEGEKLDRERIAILRTLDNGGGRRLAGALVNLGGTLISTGKLQESMDSDREALAIYDALGDRTSLERGSAMSGIANALRYFDPPKAVDAHREAIAYFEANHPTAPPYALLLRNFAVVLNEGGQRAEAAVVIAKGVDVGTRAWGAEAREMAYMYQVSGIVNSALLRPRQAQLDYERAIAIDERVLGDTSTLRPILETNLARVRQDGPEWQASRERLARVAAALDAPRPTRNVAFVQGGLVGVQTRAGDLAGGTAAAAVAVPAVRELLAKPQLAGLLGTATELELLAGREAGARALHEELRKLRDGPLVGNALAAERADEAEARLLLAQGAAPRARALLAARIAEIAKEKERHPLDRAGLVLLLARSEIASGAVMEGEQRARTLLAAIEREPDREWFAHLEAEAALRVGTALVAQGKRSDAMPHLERAQKLLTERQVPTSPRLAEVRVALAQATAKK